MARILAGLRQPARRTGQHVMDKMPLSVPQWTYPTAAMTAIPMRREILPIFSTAGRRDQRAQQTCLSRKAKTEPEKFMNDVPAWN